MLNFDCIDAAGVRHSIKVWHVKPKKGQPHGIAKCGAELVRIERWIHGDRDLCHECLRRGGEA